MKELKTKGGNLTSLGVKELVRDYKNGISNKDLAEKYDISNGTVWNHTKHLGRSVKKYAKTAPKISKDDVDNMEMAHKEGKGISVETLSEWYGISEKEVKGYLGHEEEPSEKKYKKTKTMQRMDIFRRLGQGQDVYTIARETGYKLNSIRYFADMYQQGALAKSNKGKPFAYPMKYIYWLIILAGLGVDVFLLIRYLGY